MPSIILTTLNARYIHSAFGLRYIYANLGDLQSDTSLDEFTIHERPIDIVEKLLAKHPRIIGFGVYIWNVAEISETITLVKRISPETIIVLGGPEVSHPPDLPEIAELADYIVTGNGERSFRLLCEALLSDQDAIAYEKIVRGEAVDLDALELPYSLYSEEDIRNRIIYVEASRGCPFKCEFCLSSLDKTAKPFGLTRFLEEMDTLFQRGARNFKFIDRTFNLKVSTSVAIMEFFLERMTDDLYLHFEVIPDNLPDKLKATLKRFPPNSLQFEIGVQTFDPEIQQRISRKQNNQKTCENIAWLRENTGAHLHVDLIFGLPGDTLENFAHSFDQLAGLNPHEIQLGILKRLRGAPINRHTEAYDLRYNPKTPYNILSTSTVDFSTLQRINRLARFWDMIGNSGRFAYTLPLLLGEQPFNRFLQLSDAIYVRNGSAYKIALRRLFELVHDVMIDEFGLDREQVQTTLVQDYQRVGDKSLPSFLTGDVPKVARITSANKRQRQHQIASHIKSLKH